MTWNAVEHFMGRAFKRGPHKGYLDGRHGGSPPNGHLDHAVFGPPAHPTASAKGLPGNG